MKMSYALFSQTKSTLLAASGDAAGKACDAMQRGRDQKKIFGSKREPQWPARPSPDTRASPAPDIRPRATNARDARDAQPPHPQNPDTRRGASDARVSNPPVFWSPLVSGQCSDKSPAAERGAQVSSARKSPHRRTERDRARRRLRLPCARCRFWEVSRPRRRECPRPVPRLTPHRPPPTPHVTDEQRLTDMTETRPNSTALPRATLTRWLCVAVFLLLSGKSTALEIAGHGRSASWTQIGATFTGSGSENRGASCLSEDGSRLLVGSIPVPAYVDVYEWQSGSSAWTLLGARISPPHGSIVSACLSNVARW